MTDWDHNKFLAFDVETSGSKPEFALQSWRVAQGKSWLTSLVSLKLVDGKKVFGGGVQDNVDDPHDFDQTKRALQDMLTMALDERRTILGWNIQFDLQWALAYGLEKLVMRAKYLDGLLLWRHLAIEPEYETDRSKKKSFGLKLFVRENIPALAGYEEDVDYHDPSVEARDKLHKYNKIDVLATMVAIMRIWAALDARQRRAALIEAECLPMVARANLHGFPVDTLATKDLAGRLTGVANERLRLLEPHGVTEKVVRSTPQLGRLLYDQWGLPVLKENVGKKTKAVSRATGKEVLHELAFVDKRAKLIHEYREALGNRKKFAENILASAAYNEDGRVHPQAIIFGTYSSRFTYASGQKARGPGAREGTEKDVILPVGFALHQEKRGPLYRSVLVAPPGHDLIEVDAAGQEFRWMAILSGDETMLGLCEPGEDPHSFMGAGIGHTDYRELIDLVKRHDYNAELLRKLGKLANLSLQYRTSAKKLRVKARVDYGLPMEMPEAEKIWATYHGKYKGVQKYWRAQILKGKKCGYAETLAGRRVAVEGDWTGSMGWSMESTMINYPIQGTGGEQKYLALAVCKNLLSQHDAHFAWDLHDGLYFFSPKHRTQKLLAEMKKRLDHLPYERAWGFSPPIPLPFDAKWGSSWGALKDWKE